MRIKFTLSVLLISFYSFSQGNNSGQMDTSKNLTGKVAGLNIQTVSSSKIRKGCRQSINSDSKPLLVVDGSVVDLGMLNEINPNNIERVTILKYAEATALFGVEGVDGAICLSTKRPKIIVMSKSGFLSGASILLAGTKTGTSTNEFGIAFIENSSEYIGREFEVSYVGFEKKSFYLSDKTDTIFLEPSVPVCSEVVLTTHWCRIIRCGVRCRKIRATQIDHLNILTRSEFLIYPSLTNAGQPLTIEINSEKSTPELKIISSDGRLLSRSTLHVVKGLNRFQVATDSRWAAGTYFMQITDQLHHKVVQQKFILQ